MSDTQKKQFICPMKCEGTKTYDQSGNCPKCKMKLVPIDGDHKHGEHDK
jgi:hypothetical protein